MTISKNNIGNPYKNIRSSLFRNFSIILFHCKPPFTVFSPVVPFTAFKIPSKTVKLPYSSALIQIITYCNRNCFLRNVFRIRFVICCFWDWWLVCKQLQGNVWITSFCMNFHSKSFFINVLSNFIRRHQLKMHTRLHLVSITQIRKLMNCCWKINAWKESSTLSVLRSKIKEQFYQCQLHQDMNLQTLLNFVKILRLDQYVRLTFIIILLRVTTKTKL